MNIMPIVIEQNRMGKHQSDIISKLFQERIVFVTGRIDDELADNVVSQLLYLEYADKHRPVYLYVNSSGGEVSAGYAIINVMEYISCPVSTICISKAFSMGSVIFSCGEKGMRYIFPRSEIMIHSVKAMYAGRAADIQINAERIQEMNHNLLSLIAKNSGKSLKEVESITEHDYFMNSRKAVDFGIADSIITSNKQIN